MTRRYPGILLAGLLAVAVGADAVERGTVSEYAIEDLLKACQEGDNSARWGAVAELECEQYVRGFLDGLGSLEDGPIGKRVCPPLPGPNRPAEVRRAFTKWVFDHYDERGEPAAVGLIRTLERDFPCR